MSDTSGLTHKHKLTLGGVLSVIASLIAIIGFVFGITRIWGPDRTLIPDPHPTSGPTLRAAYIKKVDKICQATYDDNKAAYERFRGSKQYGFYFVNSYREMLHEWSALAPPRGDEDTIDSMIDLLTRSNLAYNRTLVAQTQEQYDSAEAEAAQLGGMGTSKARTYGLRVCGAFD